MAAGSASEAVVSADRSVRGSGGDDDPGGVSTTGPLLMRWSPAVLAVFGGRCGQGWQRRTASLHSSLRAELPSRSKFEGPGSGEILRPVPR